MHPSFNIVEIAMADSKTLLITGVSSVFGRALAQEALAAGHKVVGTVRSQQALRDFASRSSTAAWGRLLDVTDFDAIDGVVADIEATIGPIDVLVNNAGYGHEGIMEESPLAEMRQQFDVNAGPIGGSSFTPMNTSYRNNDFQLTAGASFRMVVDVGNWDASRVVNTPGQSGNPANPHYRDLAPLWAKGEYFPLLYSRKAVEKESKERLELVPQ